MGHLNYIHFMWGSLVEKMNHQIGPMVKNEWNVGHAIAI